ncbi:MAG: hypothetical protein PHI86_06415 [Candidatus Omnitrophica bacterium]|nr:hypothetical protein [Candidatus Omnitrophota bacterium]HOX54034.1 hypothetical protein [Candidatus Omnitrophota bacterium]
MKRIFFLLLIVFLSSGCGPPRINKQDIHLENELFSIDYPKNWTFSPQKQKTDFGLNFYGVKTFGFELKDEDYPRYFITITVLQKEKDMFKDFIAETPIDEGASNFSVAMSRFYARENFSVSDNPGSMSDIKFNGIAAKFISLKISNPSRKIIFDSNSIFFVYAGRQYQITYAIYPEFKNLTIARIQSIVYSIKPKD